MDKQALDRHITASDDEVHPEWFDDSSTSETVNGLPGQMTLEFPPAVNGIVNKDWSKPLVTKLFSELSPEDEADFREHARATYKVGDPIKTIYHPVWQDECRKMNEEASS